MTTTKQEWKKFFRWLRNGFCFVTTWFLLLLWMIRKRSYGEMMPIDYIPAVMIGTAGGVLLFCAVFTKVFLRKCGFAVRFTLFMALTILYELAFGYAAHSYFSTRTYPVLFGESSFHFNWLVFAGIAAGMYGISMGIYAVYRKKKGALYTAALHQYQQRTQ